MYSTVFSGPGESASSADDWNEAVPMVYDGTTTDGIHDFQFTSSERFSIELCVSRTGNTFSGGHESFL